MGVKSSTVIKVIWVAIVWLVLIGCTSNKEYYVFTTFREPANEGLFLAYSEDGYHWEDLKGPYLKPEAGASKIMRDPSIIRGKDNVYHMVWTTDWKGGNGFGYSSSKDLIHWTNQQFIPVMAHEPSVVNVWAPEIFYDDEQEQYIIIWASTIPFRFDKGIEDEFNNHRMYYVTTKDFITFSDTELFFDPQFSVIDCVIVKRNIDDYVLILKDNTRPMRNLKVAFGNAPLGPFKNISEPYSDFKSEGPTVLKLDDTWLIYYDNYGDKNYKALSTSDFIHFEEISEKIKLPDAHKHGTITTISEPILKKLIQKSKEK